MDTITPAVFKYKAARNEYVGLLIFGLGRGCVVVPEDGASPYFTACLAAHCDEDAYQAVWGSWGRHPIALFIYPVEG